MSGLDLHGPWSAIHRAPMVRMATPFATGVSLGLALEPAPGLLLPVVFAASLPALLLVLAPQSIGTRWQRGAVLSLWYLVFGVAWQSLRDPGRDPMGAQSEVAAEGPYLVRVDAVNGSSAKAYRADVTLQAGLRRDGWEALRGRVMITLLSGERLWPDVGDLLFLDASLRPIERVPDPGGFDRRAWARSRGISQELFAPAQQWRIAGHAPHWSDVFLESRQAVSRWLQRTSLGSRERALVNALVLGQRDELDSEQSTAFSRSGTIHVLAVSGMHVGLIYAALSFMLGWWGGKRGSRVARGLLILLALWAYAGITGAAPSVLRASFMFSLFTLAGMGRRRTDHLNSLFAAGLFLLIWDPAMLRHAGFQLSFLAVLGIIVFHGPIAALWSPKPWLLRHAWSLAVVSFSAQLLTAPLAIWMFKAFPVWFLPANLVVVTGVSLAVFGGVALIALHRVPLLGDALVWCMQALLKGVGDITAWFAQLPFAYPAIRIGAFDMLVMYLLISAIAAELIWRWRHARLVSIGCVALLLALAAARSKHRAEEASFVVYDDTRALMAAMVSGREMVIVAGSDSVLQSPYSERRIEKHKGAIGADTVVRSGALLIKDRLHRCGTTWMADSRWRSSAFNVLFVSGNHSPPMDGGHCDAVVFHDLEYVGSELVEGYAAAGHWVLASGISGLSRWKLVREAERLGIPVHVVADQGAFILIR
ncbi:MAG: ComEC/Rec2 family competence protein [Flavobacteriales bacterium]|nr:ComEC/Rec2 family competence protein [Flavobacteriales bacterium]